MELNKGLWKDSRDSKVPMGAWVRAKNILLSQKFRSIVAESGFSVVTDIPGNIIGTIPCPDYVVHFVKQFNKDKIIKVFPDGTQVDSVDTSVHTSIILNFQNNKPIEGIFKVNNKGEVIICWTDNHNPIRIINLDTVTSSMTSNDILFNPTIVENISYTIGIEDGSGNVEVGTYNVVCRFINQVEMTTDWLNISKPIFITKSVLADGYNNYEGAEAGTISTKSIVVTVNNVDTRFNKIQYGIITTINGQVTFKVVGEQFITGATHTFKYTGTENIDDSIGIEEVLIPSIKYETCKTLTQVNNRLCIGNLSVADEFGYQKYANNIKIDYVSEIKNVTTLNSGSSTGSSKIIQLNHKDRSHLHREVYAFYIIFKLLNGGYSKAYHIPGRRAVAGETSVSSLTNTGFTTNPLVYEIEDTADAVGATTNMGFWQNKNETYPSAANDPNNDFEVWDGSGKIDDIQGENVRHHRFPSVKHIYDKGIFGTSTYRITEADILGISVTDVYIPDEIKEKIVSWEIIYAKRSYDNCTILGQDFGIGAGVDTIGTTEYSRGLNYTYAQRNSGGIIIPGNFLNGFGSNLVIQSRCPDLLKDKPINQPQCLIYEMEYQLSTTRNRSIQTAGYYEFENNIIDHTGLYSVNDTVSTNTLIGGAVNKVNSTKYVAGNTIEGNIDNRLGDEYIRYEIDPSAAFPITGSAFHLDNPASLQIPTHFSPLYSIVQLKDDIYLGFNKITEFVFTGTSVDKNNTSVSNVFGGDIFIVDHCSVRYGVGMNDVFSGSYNHGSLHHIIRGILECTNNWSLRHIDLDDIYTYYYPRISSFPPNDGFGNLDKNIPLNTLYNTDFTKIHDKTVVSAYDYTDTDVSDFPFTIARATAVSLESSAATWGKFLANDYYVMPRHKGEVWKLEEMGTSLLINQKNTFHVARLKDKLANDVSEIFVGVGDIFDRPPQENIPTPLGYAGCQSQYATCLTKHGYVFIDSQQGKVFLYNGNLIELSNKGVHDWFLDILPFEGDNDNPYTQSGLTCTFDEEFNRLIIGARRSKLIAGSYPTLDTGIIYNVGDIVTDGVNIYLIVDTKIKADEFYYPETVDIDVLGSTETGYAEIIEYGDIQYYNNSQSFTISYSFDFQCWVCEHDYLPNFMYYTRNGAYSIRNYTSSKIYKFNNSKHRGLYYEEGITYPSEIDVPFIFKEEVILNSVQWKSDIYLDVANSERWIENETTEAIAIYNKNQCSGLISLVDKNPARYSNTFRRNTKGLWNFNNFRDIVINHNLPFIDTNRDFINTNLSNSQRFYKKLPFISDYFVIRFVYNNEYDTFKEWYLNEVNLIITPTKLK